ncbi:hypothetical protein KIH07_04485 [Hydrogenophaga taeniospiralis]|jgi:hypothetical protein|uniref:hypothetical protein n=1 Tax=Hydrogenophaga taeniospiralis TaxID=65656 RepID=UPI001CFBC5A3|nr:hypothetical protein [Hydrogenophaga taeniospiralis]MCB4362977.1 hypothetical protein [Hydrogenophaga taeniospiralis]
MKKSMVIGAALLWFAAVARAATPTEQMEGFLLQLDQQGVEPAVQAFFRPSPGASVAMPQILMMQQQLKTVLPTLGTASGFEKVREWSLAPSLMRLMYLGKYPQTPLIWSAYFYKSSDGQWWPARLDISTDLNKALDGVN